jgi:peptidoglycan/xylan/chitin deacetylase (PgdA/CDA1 family)
MRILHLLSQTELTGAEVYAQQLIEDQVRDGHHVLVVSDRIHVKLPVAWQSLPLSTSKILQKQKNIRRLKQLLQSEKIDLIHCHSRAAVRHGARARSGLPVALVTTLHGRQHFSWSKRLFNIYGEIQIANCENVRDAFVRDFGWPASPIRILRNPLQIENPPLRIQKAGSGFHLGLLGRSSGPKGRRFEEIARGCFEPWLRQSSDFRISVVAPRPENFSQDFHSLILDLQKRFQNRVQILGEISNLCQHLPEFDLTICSGRIAMESLLSQVPTLALGEYCSHGLVRRDNFDSTLASNFGDIGALELEAPLHLNDLFSQVQDLASGKLEIPASELQTLSTLISENFDRARISKQILEAYRAAIFKRRVPRWTPILMYHKVPEQELQSRHRIFVTRANFEKHLRFFARRGFQTLLFSDLEKFWTGEKPFSEFPAKPLILTFDDGYRDNLIHAEPLLKAHGFRAVIYLLGNHRILQNTWDTQTGEPAAELMSLQEKKQLDPAVWEIGSHGFDHVHLTQVSEEEAFSEMQKSRLQLEKDFQRPILSFAYPFGSTSPRLQLLAARAGYKFAVNTDQGGLHLADDRMALFRVNIFPEDGPWQLWKKTSAWYRRSFYRKRGR